MVESAEAAKHGRARLNQIFLIRLKGYVNIFLAPLPEISLSAGGAGSCERGGQVDAVRCFGRKLR
jgi:hypothetical protein